MSYAASFLSCELFLNNRSLGRVGGYFFAIASRYPVATTRKTIASTSVILTHPLSGERYRRRIAPAQDVSITVYQTTHKRANNDDAKGVQYEPKTCKERN